MAGSSRATRAKAAQAAADFESTLAQRRDQAERDFTEQMKANENQLSVVAHRAEQLRLEAEKLRADADRKSQRTMDEAQRQADETISEAKAVAERIRSESERELSAATQRRDSINAQLTNVRQMLATLTGATLPNPLPDVEDSPKAAPQPPAAKGPAGPAAGSLAAPASNVATEPKPDAKPAAAEAKPGAPGDAKEPRRRHGRHEHGRGEGRCSEGPRPEGLIRANAGSRSVQTQRDTLEVSRCGLSRPLRSGEMCQRRGERIR